MFPPKLFPPLAFHLSRPCINLEESADLSIPPMKATEKIHPRRKATSRRYGRRDQYSTGRLFVPGSQSRPETYICTRALYSSSSVDHSSPECLRTVAINRVVDLLYVASRELSDEFAPE